MYAQKYRTLCRLYTIGHSVNEKPMFVMEISDNPGVHEPGEPEMKLVANIHGNEVVGRELMIHLIHYLLSNYATNTTVRELVDNTRLHILPTANPDGYERSAEGNCERIQGRDNINNVDLNRNFPDPFQKTVQTLERETEALISWMHEYPFVLSLAFHGGTLVVTYPYDNNNEQANRESKSPDDDVFRYLALIYARHNSDMRKGYCVDSCNHDGEYFPLGITNGAAWYPISGGMQDWNYRHTNCFELTIELGCEKYPPAHQLINYWNQNLDSILRTIDAVHTGIEGFVLNQDGTPVANATITVWGIEKNVTSTNDGDYWRLLVPDRRYTITATKDGYTPETKMISSGHNLQLNFTLRPSE